MNQKNPDICLILEGTYPYITGGVSTWAHNLIRSQSEFTFHLVCLLPPDEKPKPRYEIPDNVTGITHIFLQKLPKGTRSFSQNESKKLIESIEAPLVKLLTLGHLDDFKDLINKLHQTGMKCGADLLLNSEGAWAMLLRMNYSSIVESSFINFFWSWRGILGGLYSVLLAQLPQAALYHSLSTGYAGLFLARASIETGKPCLITEHGIYTNERRMEITTADWLYDQKAMDLNIESSPDERDLKEFWIDTFISYSKLSYDASSAIITLFEGNKEFQIADGADPNKIRIIPNGVEYERFARIPKKPDHPPTIALIGRVVPVKDTKNFIHATTILKDEIPDLRSWIIGPTDEDEEYFQECVEIVQNNNLQNTITFTGRVTIDEYIGEIDVIVLTSISESQPLVILEAGAAGIPCVATEVGSCAELIYGRKSENPSLGPGGAVCPLSDPVSIANQVNRLLTDRSYYQQCAQSLQTRIRQYYHEKDQKRAYKELYEGLITQEEKWPE